MDQDIRWKQRLHNFINALKKLEEAVEFVRQNPPENQGAGAVLDDIVKEGLIQRFEYTHELARTLMKDYAAFQGNADIAGSRDATREAFQMKLIEDGRVWMDMIASRNLTSHTYKEDTANQIFEKILSSYFPAMLRFKEVMQAKLKQQ